MKALVDSDLCTGCALCVDTCPEVFQMDDDETLAVVITDLVPPDAEGSCRQTVEDCPSDAITIEG